MRLSSLETALHERNYLFGLNMSPSYRIYTFSKMESGLQRKMDYRILDNFGITVMVLLVGKEVRVAILTIPWTDISSI